MRQRQLLLFIISLCAGLGMLANPAWASTLTVTFTGTPGPLLAGSDPLNVRGQPATITVNASESLTPTTKIPGYVAYSLPPGAVSISIIGITLSNSANATLSVKLTSKADILQVVAPAPLGVMVTMTAFLAPGSWSNSIFQHPIAFSPSPQNLSPASVARQSGSQVKYVFLGSLSILGFTGTAAATSAAAPPEKF